MAGSGSSLDLSLLSGKFQTGSSEKEIEKKTEETGKGTSTGETEPGESVVKVVEDDPGEASTSERYMGKKTEETGKGKST